MKRRVYDNNFNSDAKRWFHWVPTSMTWLIKAEQKMLSVVKCKLTKYYVRIFHNSAVLWTVAANKECKDKIPLVLIHGFASGVALWCLNYDALSQRRTVYAFDLLGFGRSSRITFPGSPIDVEQKFVESIEDWRSQQNIKQFHLLGHSFGGFLAGCYALKYPDHVKSLILADPWGFPDRNVDTHSKYEIVRWGKSVQRVLTPLNPFSEYKTLTPWAQPHWLEDMIKALGPLTPLSPVRAAGPMGPMILKKMRKDYRDRFPEVNEKYKDAVYEYIFHCNASKPTGEFAFKILNKYLGYTYLPMVNRMTKLRPGLPVTFIFGSDSFITSDSGHTTKKLLKSSDVEVHVLEGAGHHVYAEKTGDFHKIVNDRCDKFDKK